MRGFASHGPVSGAFGMTGRCAAGRDAATAPAPHLWACPRRALQAETELSTGRRG